MEAEIIADEARNAISSFCVDECQAYCCRKGYLILSAKEKDLLIGSLEDSFVQKEILKPLDFNEYALFMGSPGQPCPKLDGSKCTIHTNLGRPETCRRFPVFIYGKKVRFSSRCLAVKQGKMYPFIKQFMAEGYEVIDN